MKVVILTALSLSAIACKQNATVQNFNVTINPSSPVVISSGFSVNSTDQTTNTTSTQTVAPAWAQLVVNFKNSNATNITIAEIIFSGTATGTDGSAIQISSSFGASELIPPPVSSDGTVPSYIADVDGNGGTFGPVTVYIQSLPCNVSSYDFSITATLVGWEGTHTAPTKDFQKEITFETSGTPLASGVCPTGS